MNRLHVYTGTGKGKTTAAMGLAVRSLGHGNRVLVGQFMKDGRSGELISLEKCGAEVYPCPPVAGFVRDMSEEQRHQTLAAQQAYVQALRQRIAEYRPQTIILDELGVAAVLGMVSQDLACALIEEALCSGETVVTGYQAPDWLLERASYITRMEALKHPFETEKQQARKGVEW